MVTGTGASFFLSAVCGKSSLPQLWVCGSPRAQGNVPVAWQKREEALQGLPMTGECQAWTLAGEGQGPAWGVGEGLVQAEPPRCSACDALPSMGQ